MYWGLSEFSCPSRKNYFKCSHNHLFKKYHMKKKMKHQSYRIFFVLIATILEVNHHLSPQDYHLKIDCCSLSQHNSAKVILNQGFPLGNCLTLIT